MQAIWFVSLPPHNRPSITRGPTFNCSKEFAKRKKVAALGHPASCESDQRPKDWTTNLLLFTRCEIPPTNRFRGITLT